MPFSQSGYGSLALVVDEQPARGLRDQPHEEDNEAWEYQLNHGILSCAQRQCYKVGLTCNQTGIVHEMLPFRFSAPRIAPLARMEPVNQN